MLEAGFLTTAALKARLLPDALTAETEWDAVLAKLGIGAARKFNAFCNRVFERTEDQVDEFSALSDAVVLRAFPVETITSVDLRVFTGSLMDYAGGYQIDQRAGLMKFATSPGGGTERTVITYDGGFWLDDGDDQPAGSTALPDDIVEAFVIQCQAWADARNIFGTVSLKEDRKTSLSPVQLMAEVQSILEPYRRYSGE